MKRTGQRSRTSSAGQGLVPLVILAALLILTSPVGHAYAYAPLQTGSGETTPGSATAPASTTPGETLADQVPDWAVIPIFVVALLTLTYIFEDELIGWLLANVLKGCSSLRIWLESIACAAMAAQSAPKLEWLQYTYNRLDKWAQLINNYIAQYETALGSFSSDLNDFTLDLADYAGLVSDVSNNFQIAGDDPRAANMPGGAGGIYQALQAWYTALQLQSDSLNQQLTDLTSEYNSDLYYSQTIQDEDADYDTQKAAFIAELQAFLKTLVCITCTSVQALLNQAQQLQEPRVVNSPSAAPAGPIPPVQPAPPPVPQPPGGGGGGGGQNLQTQEKKTCRVKLEDKVIKTDFMIQLEMDEFSLYDHPDTGEIKESKHYGKDYLIGDAEANRAFIVVSAYGLGNEEHDVKISTDDGTQVGQVTLNSTPGGYDFVWKLESARVTDPRYDPADTDYDQPKFQLEGLDRLRSASTKGSIVILPIEVENLYREWEVQGDVLYFDGKLLDFELDLTCTATARPGPRAVAANVTQSASGTDTQALPSKTKKFTITATGIKAGDKGDQTDDYQISLNQDTTADTTAGFGTGIEDVSMAFGTGGTLFASGWTAAAPSCQFPANAVTMMAGDYTYLQWSATQKVEFDLTAQYGGCAPDTLHFQETTVLQGENHAEVSEDSFDWAIKSDSGDVDEDEWGTLGVVDDGTVLVAPDVDKDEDFTMTFTVQDVATEEVVMTKTFRITVNPYKNVMDWLDEDKLHEKLVSSGAIQSGDGASLKLYHPMEPDLWELVDVGLYGIGMSIKLKRKYDRYEKMLKALTKEPLYPTFELSNTMPPEFAGVPRPEFSRLHPLKRVTEPLVLGCTLADLWFESTGPDYFYRGGTSATLQEAWTFYTSNVFKPGPNSPWQFTNEEQLLRYSSRVRRNRLMTSCSVRFNDLSRVKMAYEKATATVDSKIGGWESYPSDIIEQAHSQVEALVKKGVELPGGSEQTAVNQIARQLWIDAESQNIYKPKAPIVGEPKHVVRPYKLYPDPNQPAPLPVAGQPPPEVPQPTQRHELRWEWSEKTKIGTVEKFSMTHDVDAYKLDSGEFRVTKVNDVINVVKEVSPFQRRAINEYLAYLQEQVGHGVTSYGSGTPATAEEFITQMLANVEKAKTAPVQLKTPQPAPEPKMETTFGRSIRLDSFKNWSMNMISEAFQSAKQGAAWGVATYVLTKGFDDMKSGMKHGGVVGGLQSFGWGVLAAGAAGAVSGPLINIAQKFVVFGTDAGLQALTGLEGRLDVYFAERLAAAGVGTAEKQLIEKGMLLSTEVTAKLVFVGFRVFAWGAKRVIPVVGQLWLIADVTDILTKGAGQVYVILTSPNETELAWKNRLYSVMQQQTDQGTLVICRGLQVTLHGDGTTPPDSDPQSPKVTGIADPAFSQIGGYSYTLEPRSYQFTFPADGIRIEVGDEVLGPLTEGIPKYMRDLLPDLPYDNLGIPGGQPTLMNQNAQEPYKVLENQWYFLDEADKTFRDLQQKTGVYDQPVYGEQAEAQRRQYMLHLWALWRQKYATHWIRITIDKPETFVLFWWKDFNGKECTVMERKSGIIMQPNIDLNQVILDLASGAGSAQGK